MRKIFLLLTFLIIVFVVSAGAIPPDALPFGSNKLHTYNQTEVSKLAHDMCFNYLYEYMNRPDSAGITLLYDSGIQAVRGGIYPGLADAEAPMKYSWSNYAKIDIDYPYPNSEIRMVAFGGGYNNGCLVVPQDSAAELSGVSTYDLRFTDNYAKNRVGFFDKYLLALNPGSKISYRTDFFLGINNPNPSSDTAVAVVTMQVGMWATCIMDTIFVDTIKVGDFENGNLKWVEGHGSFQIPDSINVVDMLDNACIDTNFYTNRDENGNNGRWIPNLNISIKTTGAREIRVDSLKISDRDGRDLMAGIRDPDINPVFNRYSAANMRDKIYGWMLMDEPAFSNLMPFAYIDAKMASADSNWVTYVVCNQYFPALSWIHAYFDIFGDRATYLNPDIYPFGTNANYAGTFFQDGCNSDSCGPLYNYNRCLGWVRDAIDEDHKDFWVITQAFEGKYWRYPTGPELSAEVFMALSWGAKGITPWCYDDNPEGDQYRAIRTQSQEPTPLYNEIKNHIGPYLQAFDQYYMPLTWDTSYVYKSGVHEPPSASYVSSISATSEGTNPDLGWFQVGEFHEDSTTAKYVMLVNRACNIDSSTEAPPVMAVVKFDPATVGSDYVYIIDIAHTTHFVSGTGWVADPETTYSSGSAEIPFTTVLRAGEGGLYKIMAARNNSPRIKKPR